jgi:phosphotransferase system HPr-like phosphotransfer protein
MSLAVPQGEDVVVVAQGDQAERAIDEIAALLENN